MRKIMLGDVFYPLVTIQNLQIQIQNNKKQKFEKL